MSVLRAIESRIEGLFEGVFGRAFRTHVQPVELARKLAKEMDEHRSVSVSRVYVPNEYTLYLSPGDRSQFAAYEGSLVGELQEYLGEHARREGYALLGPPRVLLETDADLAVGEFGIATRLTQPEDGAAPVPPARLPDPVVLPAPEAPVAAPATEALAAPMVVPGSPQPEAPPEVAPVRRHAELSRDGSEGWTVVDLGSTNGTEVNGRRITKRTPLEDGDRIAVGGTELVFGHSRT